MRAGRDDLEFAVFDRMRLRSFQFKVGGLEIIDTPMGSIEAVRIERINQKRRKTTLWFAPKMDFMPVKIVQNDGEHTFASIIRSTSFIPNFNSTSFTGPDDVTEDR